MAWVWRPREIDNEDLAFGGVPNDGYFDAPLESQRELDRAQTVSFEKFLSVLRGRPETLIRNVHQVFHDMVHASVDTGEDEYPEDPESIMALYFDALDRQGEFHKAGLLAHEHDVLGLQIAMHDSSPMRLG